MCLQLQMDFKANGHIVDDVSGIVVCCMLCQSNFLAKLMHEIMVKPLPAGCRLTAIFDASLQNPCHIFTDFCKIVLSLGHCIG